MVTESSVASIPATPTVFNAVGAPTAEFKLPDMMCEDSCATAVEDILSRQPGVAEVQIDFEGKTAKVAIDEGQFDSQQAIAALVDKGFDNSALVVVDESAKPTADSPAEQTSSCCEEPDSCCEEPEALVQ